MNGYTCVVCIKQVPDTKKVTGQAMKADGTINRAALPAIFNPEDKNALEAALSVKERYGGKVTQAIGTADAHLDINAAGATSGTSYWARYVYESALATGIDGKLYPLVCEYTYYCYFHNDYRHR